MRAAQRLRSSSVTDGDRSDMRPIDDFFAPMKCKASGNIITSPNTELATKMTKLTQEKNQKSLPVQNADHNVNSKSPEVS